MKKCHHSAIKMAWDTRWYGYMAVMAHFGSEWYTSQWIVFFREQLHTRVTDYDLHGQIGMVSCKKCSLKNNNLSWNRKICGNQIWIQMDYTLISSINSMCLEHQDFLGFEKLPQFATGEATTLEQGKPDCFLWTLCMINLHTDKWLHTAFRFAI